MPGLSGEHENEMATTKIKHNSHKPFFNSRWTAILPGLFLMLSLSPLSAHAITVDKLIRHIDKLWRGKTSKAKMTMTVKTRRYERSMEMEAWSRGKNYSLVVIDKPIKDRDIATLKVRNNIWNYLPKINRVIKVAVQHDVRFLDGQPFHERRSGQGKHVLKTITIPASRLKANATGAPFTN